MICSSLILFTVFPSLDFLMVTFFNTFQDTDHVPMSGGTVYVNRRPCSYPKHARLSADVHQHIRRFIITRDQNRYTSSSTALRPKSALGLNYNRPKSAW